MVARTGQALPARRVVFAFVAAAVLGLLGSCSSFPKPESADDTLLLIPVDFIVKATHTYWAYSFGLECEGLTDPILISPTASHYVKVTGLPAGTFKVKSILVYPYEKFHGTRAQSQDISSYQMVITTAAHTATMTSFGMQSVLSGGPQTFGQDFHFVAVSDTLKSRVLDELTKEDNFKAWDRGF